MGTATSLSAFRLGRRRSVIAVCRDWSAGRDGLSWWVAYSE